MGIHVLLRDVVIGHSLEAALFAFHNEYYYICSTSFQPLFFEECAEFSLFGTKNKKQIYEQIKNLLGLLSLNIEYENVQQIRIQQNKIKIFDTNLLFGFEFERCYIVDKTKVTHENSIMVPRHETYKVIDDFKLSRIGKDVTGIAPYRTTDRLISQAYFYNSMRIDGAKYVTDAVTVSNLTREQLYDFDYSDTMVTFKLKKILNDMGYTGLKQNFAYKSGNIKTKKINLDHIKRYVIPIDNNKYKDTEKVKFLHIEPEGFINGFAS